MHMVLNINEDAMATTLIHVDTSSQPQPSLLQPAFSFVIFDMDGTLVDTFELNVRSFKYALGKFLKETLGIEEALSVPGRTLEEQLANYLPPAAIPRAFERYHAHYKHHFTEGARVYPGIRALLFTLRARGVELAVCTGQVREIASHTLDRSGLSQFFKTVVTGDDVSNPKPDPEGLRTVMKTIGARPEQTVYLGDHPNDVLASRNAGVKPAATCWGSMHKHELEALGPDFLFKQTSEALALSDFRIRISASPHS